MKNIYDFIYYTYPVWVVGILYLIFSFIAMDFNPAHWLLFTTVIGRFISIILVISLITGFKKMYDEANKY